MMMEFSIAPTADRYVLRDVFINWRYLLAGRFPSIGELEMGVEPHRESGTGVFIKIDDLDVKALYAWMREEMPGRKYAMYGRYEMTERQIRVDRKCHGFRFVFNDVRDAIYFKMRWG